MKLTKQYLRYIDLQTFGLIASSRCNINFLNINEADNRYLLVGAAENLIVWDLKTGEKLFQIPSKSKKEVCQVAASPDLAHIAVGLSDGIVEIYAFTTWTLLCQLVLHQNSISCLRFNENGLMFASGGLDTDIVVCDIVNQTGKCRLQGHTGPITDVRFMTRYNEILISCSKDTQVINLELF